MIRTLLIFSAACFFSCNARERQAHAPPPASTHIAGQTLGGPCEGCEAVHEYVDRVLRPVDTLPGFMENEPRIHIFGTVFQRDGKTPAPDVIVYAYHTNRQGVYPKKDDATGWGKRHGYLRGWVKTGPDGRYHFYTFRPASYPDRDEPEHIHMTVKEPTRKEYYIDDILFDDDPLLDPEQRNKRPRRGGSGIVQPVRAGNIYEIRRDITLGLNIPAYE